MKVFINPGHAPNGVPDPGAVGCGLVEALSVVPIADAAAAVIRAGGVTVEQLQSDSLYEIVDRANESLAEYFVSIHCNASPTATARGVETYCYYGSPRGFGLARAIQRSLVKATGMIDRGVKAHGYYVLANTWAPAVLVECGFIDNPWDATLIESMGGVMGRAIGKGVLAQIAAEHSAAERWW